jgi:hypothetical protein
LLFFANILPTQKPDVFDKSLLFVHFTISARVIEPYLVCAGEQFLVFLAAFLVKLAFVIFPDVSGRL